MGALVEISVVVPCFNEEANVRQIHAAVREQLEAHATDWEIIFIDNASADATRSLMRELCATDGRTRAIFNTRNFGQMRSPTYGIYQANGAAVIAMSADFQDPPALIGPFIEAWRRGAKIVLGQPRAVPVGPIATAISKCGYWFLSRFGDYPVIPRVTGFGLFDRAVVRELMRWNEPEPFFRGMLVESGHAMELVPFDKPERQAGETKNNFFTLLDFALSSLSGSAKRLLRVPLYVAVLGSMLALLIFMGGLAAIFLADGLAAPMLTVAILLGLFSMLMLFIGVLGEQVRQIAERSRSVPLVIEAERIGFPAQGGQPESGAR